MREHALLPPHHRAVHMVKHVGMRIAQVCWGAGTSYLKGQSVLLDAQTWGKTLA